MYDGHNDGRPEAVQRATEKTPPLGVKILYGFAILSFILSGFDDVGTTLGLVALAIGLLRIGLLYALMKMKSWAWTAYLVFQFAVLAFFGLAALAGSIIGILEFGLAVIVIAYLFSIKDLYKDSTTSAPV